MKKIFLMAALVLSGLVAKAQVEPGTFTLMPKVGLNMATMTGLDETKMKAGAVAGVEAEYRATDLIGVSAGLLYSMQGVRDDVPQGSSKYCNDYINIPILANFYVWKGLALKVGIQPGFMVSSKYKWDDGDGHDGDTDTKDYYESFDFSVPVGASYEWNGYVLDLRYNIGVTKVNKNSGPGIDDTRNGVLAITLGYKFSL